jgi:dihydroflavonol-4-reductase
MIVITGASGLVGGNLVRALLAQGRTVRALVHHDRRALDGLQVETVSADITDPGSLKRAFTGAETVYHLASSISINLGNWDELEAINVTGTCNVVEACLRAGVKKLVYFSSIHAYQQVPFDQPLDADRSLVSGEHAPPYERSKAAAELIVRQATEHGLNAVIIIPTAIIGPNDFRPSYLGQALRLLIDGRIPALVHGGYDWVDVRDVVEGAIQAERLGKNGVRYILSGHWRSLIELAHAVSAFTGKATPRLVVPLWLANLFQPVMAGLARINHAQPLYTRVMLAAMHSNRQISHERAARELGYAPRPFEDTIRDAIDWINTQGGQP